MLKVNDKISIPANEIQLSYVRSSGPGGQNVNKVASKVVLKWDIGNSSALPEAVRKRFIEKFSNRISSDGTVQITSDQFRDRPRNVHDCEQRLLEMILSVAKPPKLRKETKPSKSSVQKRLNSKKALSEKKKQRQRIIV